MLEHFVRFVKTLKDYSDKALIRELENRGYKVIAKVEETLEA